MFVLVRNAFAVLAAVSALAQECRLTPLTPAQPPFKIEEGERATESQTFQTTGLALSPGNVPHFFDTASRIRRIEPTGRLTTLAGNGTRQDNVTPGPALANGLPAISIIRFSPSGVLHFAVTGRVFRLVNGNIEVAAGSGRPGFNGEEAPAADIGLGGIVDLAFDNAGTMLILDGYNRLRRLDPDGWVRTIAGSTRPAATTGRTGDDGPGTLASLSSPRQIVPRADGSIWIKDFSGRHLRSLTPDGIIRTFNTNFEPTVNILKLPEDRPAAGTSNRVYPILPSGFIATGENPFPPFTGTPLAIGTDGSLFFSGSTRPDQRNPLLRMTGRTQTVIGGAPVQPVVDGQAPPYGIWNTRTNSLFYSASVDSKTGVLEARPGQTPRFVVGGGTDIGDPEGKNATDLAIFGVVAFTIDGEGRIIVADVNRRRILVVGTDSKVSVLKAGGQEIIYTVLGSLSTLQRITADNAGNIYWYSRGGTETVPGSVFTADISVWARATGSVSTFTVVGLSALNRLDDGSIVVLAGNGANFRSAYPAGPLGASSTALPDYRMLPLVSVTRFRDKSYFVAATRLFRGQPGAYQWLEFLPIPGGLTFNPDYVLVSRDNLIVHLADGGFYRIEDVEQCRWVNQPTIQNDGIVNAASYEFPNTASPRSLLTVYGTGLGPAEGQGMVLSGELRAGGQPAPYPGLSLNNFSGTVPLSTLTASALPVIYSDDKRMTIQTTNATPAGGTYLLFFPWQGLTLIHPTPIRIVPATPGLFMDGDTAMAVNEDGSRHGKDNPAPAGSLIQLLGTGFGAIDGTLANGDFVPATAPRHTNVIEVMIGEEPATVEFAGGLPGAIGGTTQLQVRIPEGLASGSYPVTITMPVAPQQPKQRALIHVR